MDINQQGDPQNDKKLVKNCLHTSLTSPTVNAAGSE